MRNEEMINRIHLAKQTNQQSKSNKAGLLTVVKNMPASAGDGPCRV